MLCENCGIDHEGVYGSGRFCSSKCARGYSTKVNREAINIKVSKTLTKGEWHGISNPRKNKKTECINCGMMLSESATKYCSIDCQTSYQRSSYIELWKQGEVTGNCVNGLCISKHIRNYLLEQSDYKCSICGWGEKNLYSNTYPLILDHIDGHSDNNNPDNLRIICPNCDSLTPTYKSLNNGNGRRYWRYRSRK